jgi:8-oxo-dGTP diphosphatase
MKKNIHVVGAVIVKDNKILCAQRGPNKSLAMMWEFPGGKIEENETPEEALVREINEEMNCEIKVGNKITTTVHEYEFAVIHLTTFYCELISGTPILTDHIKVKWLSTEQLLSVEWAPADVPTIEILMR